MYIIKNLRPFDNVFTLTISSVRRADSDPHRPVLSKTSADYRGFRARPRLRVGIRRVPLIRFIRIIQSYTRRKRFSPFSAFFCL